MSTRDEQAIDRAMSAPGCERLREWAAIGPVQRAAVESFADALAAPPAAPLVPLPKEPPPGLLMSMAIRFDHGLGVPGYYDGLTSLWPKEARVTHAQRLESTLRTMRQLYEEVSGHGFYSPAKEAAYAACINGIGTQEGDTL